MAERYPGAAGRSEYGGGDGSPQRNVDGSSLDLPGIPSAVGERARVMRAVGMRDFDPSAGELIPALDTSGMSAAQREAYEADRRVSAAREADRLELRARTNGYSDEPDQYVGESGEGNGVDSFE